MDDLISRRAAMDAVYKSIFCFFDICDDDEESPMTYKDEQLLKLNKAITNQIKAVPSANPGADEWCEDCREYDKENHCCPRFNRVIRKTLDEAYAHGETEAEARFLEKLRREGR